MIYSFRSGGGTHVGVLNLADRSKRPLTHSPGVDDGAEWTPDKTILFSRHQDVSRIFTADLTKLLASPQQ